MVASNKQAIAHSNRFRKVSNLYPRMVAFAYDKDLAAAARDTDEEVAARVAAYQRSLGEEPTDWYAVGREEGRDEDAPQ
jgi:hypothetical protein